MIRYAMRNPLFYFSVILLCFAFLGFYEIYKINCSKENTPIIIAQDVLDNIIF